MQYKGIVFFDYDGTITDGSADITSPTKKTVFAIENLKKNGYITALCTGRSACYARHITTPFDIAVTLNGMYISQGDKVILDKPVSEELSAEIIGYMDSNGIHYCLDMPDKCYCTDVNYPGFLKWTQTYNIDKSCFSDDVSIKPKRVYKVGAHFDSEEQYLAMKCRFDGVLSIDMQLNLYADISPCGQDKGMAVKALIEHFKILREDTYAFGDGENDRAMFAEVGHAIAMGKHSKALEECAEFITKTVAEEGIEYGLLHYGLICCDTIDG